MYSHGLIDYIRYGFMGLWETVFIVLWENMNTYTIEFL